MTRGDVKHTSGLVVRDAKLSRAKPFRWLWDQRILLGYLNLMVGEEGVGKSNFVGWAAAQVTRGELAGTLHGEPRRIAVVGDEDGWDHVWTPRLKASGADLRQCKHVVSGTAGALDVTRSADVAALKQYVTDENVALVFFDQVLDNLGYTDNWKDKMVRDALAPMRDLARSTNCAVLLSLHPNKRTGSFRDRVSGSPAFNALSRSSMYVVRHPDGAGRVVVVRAKGNYSEEPQAFEFRIAKTTVKPPGRPKLVTSHLVDVRESELRAADVLDAQTPRRRDDSNVGRARAQLAELLADGERHEVTEIYAALRTQGFDDRTIRRASTHLKVRKAKVGYQGGWVWQRR